ncbi:MAG TPA: ABC transporter substrate-binding protein [Candidatus Binatia bacterium]|jgi:ABC-type nitrate/sulfonate/bicarbonate transport system substrate-binding protein
MRSILRFLATGFILVVFGPAAAPAQTTVRIGVPAAQTNAIPIYVGIQRGIFSKRNLIVQPIVIPNGRINVNALISGGTDYINGSAPELFFVGEQGADIVGVGSWDDSSPYNLVTREKIRSIRDLKGKRLAAGGMLDKSHLFLKLLLARDGFEAGKDAEILFIGSSSARLTMLASGKIDAAPVAPEFARRAEKLGLYVLPVAMPYSKGLITTRKSNLAKNREAVKTFLAGYAEAVTSLINDKEETIQIMARLFRLQDREVLEGAYNAFKSHAQPDLYPSEEGLRNVLKTLAYENPRFASVPPLKHMDLSIVEELRARSAQAK